MIVLRDSSALPENYKHSVLALGNFDGLHWGHRAIVNYVVQAHSSGKAAGVMTFEPHPRRVFRPELPPMRIFPFREKVRLLSELGIDFIRVVRFTRAFSETTAEQFITDILHRQMQVSEVVTGEDFTFGHNKEGNVDYLRDMAAKLGFETTAFGPITMGEERLSSTRIRTLLGKGDVRTTAVELGRPYYIRGRVQSGDKRGRTIGFPTANILPTRIFLPASGVYAVHTVIDGKHVNGVANLGSRPTVGGTQMRLETHLFDYQGDLYGKTLAVDLIERIRSEEKFDGLDALKAQIALDCQRARIIFK